MNQFGGVGAAVHPSRATSWLQAPTLAGQSVVLERLAMRHADGLLRAADADEVFTHLRVRRPATLGEVESMVELADSGSAAGTSVTWVQTVGGEVAGLTTYYDLSPETRSLAIGSTWLARRWQRSGVNREAKLLLLRRAFDGLGCVRVVWHVDELNLASRAAVLALGATEEGFLRKHKTRLDGSWRTTVQFSLTDDDWPLTRQRLEQQVSRGLTPPRGNRHTPAAVSPTWRAAAKGWTSDEST